MDSQDQVYDLLRQPPYHAVGDRGIAPRNGLDDMVFVMIGAADHARKGSTKMISCLFDVPRTSFLGGNQLALSFSG